MTEKFDKNRLVTKQVSNHIGDSGPFYFNAESIKMVLDSISLTKQERACDFFYDHGYRLKRFGEFSKGQEFAAFVPME